MACGVYHSPAPRAIGNRRVPLRVDPDGLHREGFVRVGADDEEDAEGRLVADVAGEESGRRIDLPEFSAAGTVAGGHADADGG